MSAFARSGANISAHPVVSGGLTGAAWAATPPSKPLPTQRQLATRGASSSPLKPWKNSRNHPVEPTYSSECLSVLILLNAKLTPALFPPHPPVKAIRFSTRDSAPVKFSFPGVSRRGFAGRLGAEPLDELARPLVLRIKPQRDAELFPRLGQPLLTARAMPRFKCPSA